MLQKVFPLFPELIPSSFSAKEQCSRIGNLKILLSFLNNSVVIIYLPGGKWQCESEVSNGSNGTVVKFTSSNQNLLIHSPASSPWVTFAYHQTYGGYSPRFFSHFTDNKIFLNFMNFKLSLFIRKIEFLVRDLLFFNTPFLPINDNLHEEWPLGKLFLPSIISSGLPSHSVLAGITPFG